MARTAPQKQGFPKGKKLSEIPRSPLGERLYRTRKARGISQTELGKHVGLSQRMVSHYEGAPLEGPPLATLAKMAKALNVTLSYLLGESTLKGIKDDISPPLRRHMRTVQQLPAKDQKKVFEYAELLAKSTSRRSPSAST